MSESSIRMRGAAPRGGGGASRSLDTVKATKDSMEALMRASRCWSALQRFRDECRRNYRYTFGDQWGDDIRYKGRRCKEKEAIIDQGNVPLTNNLIFRLVRTLVGVHRKEDKIPMCVANDRDEQQISDMMNTALQVNWKNNGRRELDASGFMRYLITGWAMSKEVWGFGKKMASFSGEREDCWTMYPKFDMAFWDTNMDDPRGWDMSIVGELHDMTFNQVCRYFARSRRDCARLRGIYGLCRDGDWMRTYYSDYWIGSDLRGGCAAFLTPKSPGLCRVVEVWTKEVRPRWFCHDTMTGEAFWIEEGDKGYYDLVNRRRAEAAAEEAASRGSAQVATIEMEWRMCEYWYVRFLAPTGDVLAEHETEYDHGEHPYTLKLYPFTNGEIHSFVSDVIDQQRYINRMISLNDKLIRSAAKGVLLYPVSMIPEGKTPEQIQREWNQSSSVMFYDDLANMASGAKPEQFANKLINIGTSEMIQMEMSLMEDISGVTGALQGKPGFAGQSAALYAQQTQNASVAVLDLLDSYDDFVLGSANKKVKNIQQYYPDGRYLVIGGRQEPVRYDAELCGDADLDLTLYSSADSPDSRRISQELLAALYQQGAITPSQFVKESGLPYSTRLAAILEANERAAAGAAQDAQQGGVQEIPEDIRREVAGSADSVAVRNAERIMRDYDIYTPEQAQEAFGGRQQQQQQQ